jgi:hypothetical protein
MTVPPDTSNLAIVVSAAERTGNQFRNLILVLSGNYPRFPWKPSTPRYLTGSLRHQVSIGVAVADTSIIPADTDHGHARD